MVDANIQSVYIVYNMSMLHTLDPVKNLKPKYLAKHRINIIHKEKVFKYFCRQGIALSSCTLATHHAQIDITATY